MHFQSLAAAFGERIQSMPQTQFNGITVIIRLVVEQEFGKCCGFGILPVVAVPNIERPEIVQTIAAYQPIKKCGHIAVIADFIRIVPHPGKSVVYKILGCFRVICILHGKTIKHRHIVVVNHLKMIYIALLYAGYEDLHFLPLFFANTNLTRLQI